MGLGGRWNGGSCAWRGFSIVICYKNVVWGKFGNVGGNESEIIGG